MNTCPASNNMDTGKKKQRKEKMYNWPEQEDPEQERRRQLAIKQKKKREKDEQEEVQRRVALRRTQEEIENLKTELAMRSCNIAMMEQTAASYGNNSYGGYFDSYPPATSADYSFPEGAPSMTPSPVMPYGGAFQGHSTPFGDQGDDSSYSLGSGATNDVFGNGGPPSGESHTDYVDGEGTRKNKQENMSNWFPGHSDYPLKF